jgi:membrane protein DedA with SNARE-associated domain
MRMHYVHELMNWLVVTIDAWGYPGIFLLMAMESSVLPVPSELVMPPAGFLAFGGKMSAPLAILCGTMGSLAGAYANYFVSQWLGRPLVLKYGKYVLISEKKFLRAEAFFQKHGEVATFLGRLLPVIRHLISIPAGISRMNHVRFSLYTLAGAAIWCTVLTYLGYGFAHVVTREEEVVKLVKQHSPLITGCVLAFCAIVLGVYIWFQRRKSRRAQDAADGQPPQGPA